MGRRHQRSYGERANGARLDALRAGTAAMFQTTLAQRCDTIGLAASTRDRAYSAHEGLLRYTLDLGLAPSRA